MGNTVRTDSSSAKAPEPRSASSGAKSRGVSPRTTDTKPPQAKGVAPADKVTVSATAARPTTGADAMVSALSNTFAAPKAAKAATDNAAGEAVVASAREHLDKPSADLKGVLPNFQAAGGRTNNCADFVSSVLMNNGQLKGKEVNVDRLREQMEKEGWKQVEATDAAPGDVAFHTNKRHVELVTEAGGTMSIGSNNQDPKTREQVAGKQWVTERPLDPANAMYYHRPELQP